MRISSGGRKVGQLFSDFEREIRPLNSLGCEPGRIPKLFFEGRSIFSEVVASAKPTSAWSSVVVLKTRPSGEESRIAFDGRNKHISHVERGTAVAFSKTLVFEKRPPENRSGSFRPPVNRPRSSHPVSIRYNWG